MARALRPASTKFERELRGFHPLKLWGVTALCLAMSVVGALIAWNQLHTTQPTLSTVQATLLGSEFRDTGLIFQVRERRADLFVSFEPDRGALRRLFETRFHPGTPLTLAVVPEAWQAASAHGSDLPKVRVYGLSLAGQTIFSPDQVAVKEAANAQAGPWMSAVFFAMALLMGYFAWRRSPLLDAVSEASASMPARPVEALLAERGPFTLHDRFGADERTMVAIGLVVVVPLGAALLGFALYLYGGARDVERIWQSGTVAQAEVTNVVFGKGTPTKYKLQLQLEEAGQARSAETEYYLWSQEPVSRQLEVHYLPGAPNELVCEAGYRGRSVTWAIAGSLAALGLFTLGAILMRTSKVRYELDEVQTLARSGSLARAELVRMQQTSTQIPQVELVYRFEGQPERRQLFPIDAPSPWLDGGLVVVLASHDRQFSTALRADGYPLKIRT